MSGALLTWHVTETAGFESAWVQRNELELRAEGVAVAQLPEPYTASYTLKTDGRAATTLLRVCVRTATGNGDVEVRRGEDGWSVDGAAREDLAEALDIDLWCSPLTNTMPIIRHRLHELPGEEQFTMAFVRLPSLAVVPVLQRYEHLGVGAVRYSSGDFSSDLTVDRAGYVTDYPQMGRRVEASIRA